MNVNKKARELMVEYPKGITVGELQQEVPDSQIRRAVLSKMVYFAQCDKDNEIFGDNLIK